jgi:transcriptional regulator with XRE-family HTH domain
MSITKETRVENKYRQLVAKRIKQARLEANLTQIELANLMFCDNSNISYIESAKQSVDVETLIQFSKVLNKQPIFFLSDI